MAIHTFKTAIYAAAAAAAALAMNSATITLAQNAKKSVSSPRGSAPAPGAGADEILKYTKSLTASEKIEYYLSLSRQVMARADEAEKSGNLERAKLFRRAAAQYESAARTVQQEDWAARKKAAEELSVRTKNCVPAAGRCVSLNSFVFIKVQENGQPWDNQAHYTKDGCETSAHQGHSCVGMLAREAWRQNYSFVP